MVPPTEAQLLARVLAGERVAFDVLFDRSLPALWRRATQACDDRATAEALVRTVLAHALRHLEERPPERRFADWLDALARELAPSARPRPPDGAHDEAPPAGA
jgi:DNA-directed RNA polymerase specialized sigma24 family protein